MAWAPKYQTVDEFLARVRARYAIAEGERAAIIATWMMDRLDDNDITDAQARAAWGQSAAQWGQTRGKMQADRASWRAVKNAKGN